MMNGIIFTRFILFIVSIGKFDVASSQIIGGQNAEIEHYPYMASIRKNGIHACGGAIISNKHILTAAHCINKELTPPFTHASVHTGTSTSTGTGQSHKIAYIEIHPEWIKLIEAIYNNDIAVIKLKGSIRFDDKQQKVNLPKNNFISGVKADLAGWGLTELSETARPSTQLQKLQMTVISNSECDAILQTRMSENQLCVYQEKGHGSCFGDSGSPLVYNNEVIGIVSWTTKCANGAPEIFTNVYAHKKFIEFELL